MALQLRKSGAPLGHAILGVDLSRALDDATFAEIEQLWDEYGVIVLKDQKITPDQQIAFSQRFGEQEPYMLGEFLLPNHPEIFVVSNIIENGKPIGMADAGRTWHSDLSVLPRPPRGSILYALEVPRDDAGEPLGDTWFASTQAAYDALSDSMKRRIEGLKIIASYDYYIQRRIDRAASKAGEAGTAAAHAAQKNRYPDIEHPLVRVHPRTGRRCLYLSEELVRGIPGLPDSEAHDLLAELMAHATQPQFTYRHRWSEGDMVLWDNCSSLHRATGDFTPAQRRRMHRTTLRGTAPVGPAQSAAAA